MKLLNAFRDDCATWYKYHTRHDEHARQDVYLDLIARHGPNAVLRWQPAIKRVLDRAENETRKETR